MPGSGDFLLTITDTEETQARDRLADQAVVLDQNGPDGACLDDSLVAVTFQQTTYPAAAKSVYAAHLAQVTIDGPGAEGDPVLITPLADAVLFLANVGAAIPPVGTALIVDRQDGLLLARYDG